MSTLRITKKWVIAIPVAMVTFVYFFTIMSRSSERYTMDQPVRHEHMINTARQIGQKSKTIMVGVINDAYLPFAYSWLCNTKEMGIHKNILFITTDQQSSLKLKRDWPEVNVASMNISFLSGDRAFGEAGYLRVNVRRHQYIYQLLQEGFELLHFEVDCVWLKNPLPFLQSHVGYDLLVNAVSGIQDYNSGFVYIFNTKKSVRVWELLAQRMTDLANQIAWFKDDKHVKTENNDQPFWSDIIFNRVDDLKLKVLTLDKFPDGQWYRMNEAKRNKTDPYLINNNWIVGNQAKKDRAKKWGHWFIDDDMNCDMDKVRKVVKS